MNNLFPFVDISKLFVNPFLQSKEPEYIESKDLIVGDRVELLDADGYFYDFANIISVSDKFALVEASKLSDPMLVRREDLLKLVKVNK